MKRDRGAHGIWLERVEFDSIGAILTRSSSVPEGVWEQINNPHVRERWIMQVLSGLKHFHSQSLVHYDISCRNILITASLDAKLFDFGGPCKLGCDGIGAEKTRYYCPCSRRFDKQPSFIMAMFALGSAMYEILTGSHPTKISLAMKLRRYSRFQTFWTRQASGRAML